jgi:hypothetical protein
MDQSFPSLMQINAETAIRRHFCGPRRNSAMTQEYQAQPMTWEDARAAYPLVYLHDASITLDAWLDFVRQRIGSTSERGGLIVIRDRRDIVHALFAYRVDNDLRGRNQLCIAQLIVAHLPGSQIDHAVVASTSKVAAALDCVNIVIEQPFRVTPVAETKPPTVELTQDETPTQAAS